MPIDPRPREDSHLRSMPGRRLWVLVLSFYIHFTHSLGTLGRSTARTSTMLSPKIRTSAVGSDSMVSEIHTLRVRLDRAIARYVAAFLKLLGSRQSADGIGCRCYEFIWVF